MFLWRLLKQGNSFSRSYIILLTLSSFCQVYILAITYTVSRNIDRYSEDFQYLMLYIISVLLHVAILSYLYEEIMSLFQKFQNKTYMQLVDMVRKQSFQKIEEIGKSRLHQILIRELKIIADAEKPIIFCFSSISIMLMIYGYIMMLSFLAFLFIFILMIFYIFEAIKIDQEIMKRTTSAKSSDIDLTNLGIDIVKGFKEIRVNSKKNSDIFDDLEEFSEKAEKINAKVNHLLCHDYVISRGVTLGILGLIAFILPYYTEPEITIEILGGYLMTLGTAGFITRAVPIISRANIAAKNISEFKSQLEKPVDQDLLNTGCFQKLSIDQITFSYDNEFCPFHLTPIQLELCANEILFVVGNNGSGKSTFLKILTGLYKPTNGIIRFNNCVVTENYMQSYRNHFSTIFSEFHLFPKLYGISNISQATVENVLVEMKLEKKTQFSEGSFSNLKLSTGQKKRLALAVSILEDKDIYVFDEWAAEQSPEFRKYFYLEILKDLKNQGKTIIAVTHDERYFHVADKIIKFNNGQTELFERSDDVFI